MSTDLKAYKAYRIIYEDEPDMHYSFIAPDDEAAIERAIESQGTVGSGVLKVETVEGKILWQATDA